MDRHGERRGDSATSSDASFWQDYWSGGGDGEQALGGANQRRYLTRHWEAFFTDLPDNVSLVIDLAAGSGAVAAQARAALKSGGDAQILATDYSAAAMSALCARSAGIGAIVADAARLPFRDGCASAVVSQYGIEYAGETAFAEAGRVLADQGRVCLVSHYRGGAIDAECARNCALLDAVEEIGLAEAARNAIAATYALRAAGEPRPVDPEAEGRFRQAGESTHKHVSAAPEGAAKATVLRFLNDLGALSTRRLAYREQDALAWIDGMKASLAAYKGRMAAMQAAALDEAGVLRSVCVLKEFGLADAAARPAVFREGDRPAAWIIEGTKSAG